MNKISLCMIVKNEEDVIGRCLESVRDIADEIIIVDTGSTDRTKEIVSKYTSKIYDFEWVDDFSKARNFSFSKATKDYILWLDADDIILQQDYKKFIELKNNIDNNIDIYMMKYNYIVNEENIPSLVQNRARLLKRENNYQWVSPIHEVIIPVGNIENVDIAITHKKDKIKDINRNLNIFEKMKREGMEFDDRQEYCYAKELYCLRRFEEAKNEYERFIMKYEKEYKSKRNYLYPACLELSDCYSKLLQKDKQLESLMKILKYEVPGSECCCKIGEIFLENKDYKVSAFWYETAINNRDSVENNGDANIDYNEFIPYVSLCVCYYWLGDIKKAHEYNERAGKIKPNDETYIFNKKVFDR
ncbi:MAG: glycosyltransferase family 2 protein [Clostridia bacterium]|nr:glycosyltransferase family 2 protein [Clostridia bacterium]